MKIKFRGWRTDGGGWVYGYYVKDPIGKSRIYWQPFEEATSNTYHFITPESVGQYTGRQNIFKDDIVDVEDGADGLPEEMKVF